MKKVGIVLFISVAFTPSGKSQTADIRSWGFNFGFEFSRAAEFGTMRENFPDATYFNNDFGMYRHDSTVQHTPMFPTLFEGNLAIGFNTGDNSWLSRFEIRPILGIFSREVGYDNQLYETFNGEIGSDVDSILRDYYGFWWNSTNVYVGSEFVGNSKYKGKNQRFRMWYGLRVKLGFDVGRVTSYHLYGWYLGRKVSALGFEDQYEYYFPPLIYTEKEVVSSSATMFSAYLGGLGGLEWALGKKRKFHLGLQLNLGNTWMTGKTVFSAGGGGMFYTFRFLLNEDTPQPLPVTD